MATTGRDPRIDNFINKKVGHPLLMSVHEKVLGLIKEPGDASLIVVLGASGIGKTTLNAGLQADLSKWFWADMEQDAGSIPYATMVAEASETANYGWKNHYITALEALQDPFLQNRSRQTNADLKRSYVKALKNRHTKVFIIDEAQHILVAHREKNQLDVVKSIGVSSNIVHLLIGTHELTAFLNLSGQLARRTRFEEFKRYKPDAKGIEAYRKVLEAMRDQIELDRPFDNDVTEDVMYFYEGTIGCVGLLKSWLVRALTKTLEKGDKSITKKTLEREAFPWGTLSTMLSEARQGEERLQQMMSREARQDLRRELGIKTEQTLKPDAKPKKRPGYQNPVRYPSFDSKMANENKS